LTNTDFDAVVLGAGMYGGYCAAEIFRLSRQPGKKNLRVLVLDAGPFIVPEHVQNLPDIGLNVPGGDIPPQSATKSAELVWGISWRSNVDFSRHAYCVGGKSLYWGGWCPRLTKQDLQLWPKEVADYLNSPPTDPAPGTSFKSVYDMMEREIGVQPTDDFIFDPLAGEQQNQNEAGLNVAMFERVKEAAQGISGSPLTDPEKPPIAVKSASDISGTFSLDKYSSLPTLISAIRNDNRGNDANAGIFLVPNVHVSRLVVPNISKDGAQVPGYRVTGIEVFYRGQSRIIPVKPTCAVVLAMTAIESTRLALESFPTAPQRNGDELMGKNLMVHLRFDFGTKMDRSKLDQFVQQKLHKKLAKRLQQASMHVQGSGPNGRYHFQFYAAATQGANGEPKAEELMYRLIPDVRVSRAQLANQDPDEIGIVMRACGEMPGILTDQSQSSQIRLSSETEPEFGHRRAYVDFKNQDNNPIWNDMYKAMEELAKGIGTKDLPVGNRKPQKQGLGSTYHECGTLWMGDDPDNSVTDVNGRFHHISNAYCADQSLFPTSGSANPVLTGLCLANKVAEHIVHRHVSEPALSTADRNKETADGFEFLLPGANASRWKSNDGRPVVLHIQNSILEVAGGGPLAVAYFDGPQPFKNFVLRLQWKAFVDGGEQDITANSGVFIRAPKPGNDLTNFYKSAVEIQIDETGYNFPGRRFRSPLHKTGAIYEIAPARSWNAKAPSSDGSDGFWNTYEIRAKDSELQVKLNGQLVSETKQLPAGLQNAGVIALQYHSGRVHFRDIRVKRLP
jgi:choline dehydrogenase-like flavoprotein